MKNPHLVARALEVAATVVLIGGMVLVCCQATQDAREAPRPAPPRPAPPAPVAATVGTALGMAYAPALASAYGDGWTAAADTLERGGTVAEAREALRDAWTMSRERAFIARVAPTFDRVLPEGSEPATPAQRAEVVGLWRDFARGLKGGR
jgi:hypothetical protein